MKFLLELIPNLQTLAERTHPDDDDAQQGFVLDHLAIASKTLGLAGVHEDNALEAYESFDAEDAPILPVRVPVTSASTESPKDAPTSKRARRKPVTKKRKK
jgi:hypothetical protein